jgi:hypothetical protein
LNACDASYYDETACHLDLVQWSTIPKWSKLSRDVRTRLINDDAAFLASQLKNENIRLLLVNGAGVRKQLQTAYRESLNIEPGSIIEGLSHKPAILHSGTLFGMVCVVAWSINLQSSPGVKKDFAVELAERIAAIHSNFLRQ